MTETLTNYDGFCIICKRGINPDEHYFIYYNGEIAAFADVICMNCINKLLSESEVQK